MIHPKTSHLDSWWCQIQLKLLILHKYTDDIIYKIEKLEKFNDDMRERSSYNLEKFNNDFRKKMGISSYNYTRIKQIKNIYKEGCNQQHSHKGRSKEKSSNNTSIILIV